MAIRVECDRCGEYYPINLTKAEKEGTLTCPHCKTEFIYNKNWIKELNEKFKRDGVDITISDKE